MKRRELVTVLALGLLFGAPVDAQQSAKLRRIGFLGLASAKGFYTKLLESLREGLHKLGHVEGKTIAFEYRFADERRERLPALAAELVASRVDLIVTHGTPETQAAKQATRTIPIVMASVGDPVGAGLVASLGRPGGNITGLTNIDVGLAAKRLELLKEVVPKLSRVAVLRNPTNPSSVLQLEETRAAARTLGLELHLIDVREGKELESAFSAMVKGRDDALTVMADPLFLARQKQTTNLALASRLPSIFARNENVEAGGLMSYGPNLADLYRQAATYVDKILRGALPADLPIEQPTRFDLVINGKTAAALGIMIPPSILLRADRVIE